MNIIRLPAGEHASYHADRIHVWLAHPGDYRWSGALISESVIAFGSGKGFATHAMAETEGVAWAREYVVRVLMIQSGAH